VTLTDPDELIRRSLAVVLVLTGAVTALLMTVSAATAGDAENAASAVEARRKRIKINPLVPANGLARRWLMVVRGRPRARSARGCDRKMWEDGEAADAAAVGPPERGA
jgi:hypothetical protein